MKKHTYILIFAIMSTICSIAQANNGGKREKIKSLKVAYITTELSLTSDEATKFWPVFNTFEAKQQEIRSQKTKSFINRMSDEDLDKMTDKDASSLLSQLESTEDELFQNRKKLIANLKSILPAIKILKLKRAEDNFAKKLLQQYKNKD